MQKCFLVFAIFDFCVHSQVVIFWQTNTTQVYLSDFDISQEYLFLLYQKVTLCPLPDAPNIMAVLNIAMKQCVMSSIKHYTSMSKCNSQLNHNQNNNY